MRIDEAGEDESSARIDDLGSGRSIEVSADGADGFAIDENIGERARLRGHNLPAFDQKPHANALRDLSFGAARRTLVNMNSNLFPIRLHGLPILGDLALVLRQVAPCDCVAA